MFTPEPGLCATSWYCRDISVMLQVLKYKWLTTCKLFGDIVLA